MALTPKYQFVKPSTNEYVNIEDLNGNMDKVEEALNFKADLEGGKVPDDQLPQYANGDSSGRALNSVKLGGVEAEKYYTLDGGPPLAGGEDMNLLPNGVFWTQNGTVTSSLLHTPLGLTGSCVIVTESGNGAPLNSSIGNYRIQTVHQRQNGAIYRRYSNGANEDGSEKWSDWVKYATQDYVNGRLNELAGARTDIWLSNNGNDTTGNGSSGAPYKTIAGALQKNLKGDIVFRTNDSGGYNIDSTATVIGRTLVFKNGNWNLKSTLFLINCTVAMEECTFNLYPSAPMKVRGMCSFFIGDYYGVSIVPKAANGTTVTETRFLVHTWNTDIYNHNSSFSTFITLCMRGTHLYPGAQIFEAKRDYGMPIILYRPNGSITIDSGAYIHNTCTTMTQIGSSGVYVLH